MKNDKTFKKSKDNKHSRFWTNKEINLSKLTGEIEIAMGVKKWQDVEDSDGFSGLSMVDHDDNDTSALAKRYIIVHWSNDGKHGFNIDFPANMKIIIKKAIVDHIA